MPQWFWAAAFTNNTTKNSTSKLGLEVLETTSCLFVNIYAARGTPDARKRRREVPAAYLPAASRRRRAS